MSGFAILEGRRGRVCMEVGFATPLKRFDNVIQQAVHRRFVPFQHIILTPSQTLIVFFP
jgi:hypothetical protein